MVGGQRIKYKNVYDEVAVITSDNTTESCSNTTLASGSTVLSQETSSPTWSKRILDPDVQNYINFVMSDIGLSDVGMSDMEFQEKILPEMTKLTSSESMQKLETVKSFKDLLDDTESRSIWRFQRRKPLRIERNQAFGDHQQSQLLIGGPQLSSDPDDPRDEQMSANKAVQFNELVGNPNTVPIPSSRYKKILPQGTHEFIDALSDETTEDELKFFEVIPKVTQEDIIRVVNFDFISDHVIKTFVPPVFRPLFFKIKKFCYSLSDMIKRHSFMIYTIYYLFGNFIKLPFYLLYILSQSYRWILTSIFSSLITIDQILTGILDDRVIRIKLADLEPILQKKPSVLSTSSSKEALSVNALEQKPSKTAKVKKFFSKK